MRQIDLMRELLDRVVAAEAKVAVERSLREQAEESERRMMEQIALSSPSRADLETIKNLVLACQRGDFVPAIKEVRAATGCGLKDAKELLESCGFVKPLRGNTP
jgi:ribosomal protein L7/L12